MAVKIAPLDYRSTQANLDAQTVVINNFLADKTVNMIAVVDEWIMAQYNAVPPVVPTKVKVFNLVDSIGTNGVAATETAVQNFVANNITLPLPQPPISLDNGVIVLVYK